MPWVCDSCVTMKGLLPQSSRGGPQVVVLTTTREDGLEPRQGPLCEGHLSLYFLTPIKVGVF